jgi:purine-nucleoside/S-methyl-5'-thioadenosine phosphorylase / adenosine deaminase
MTSRAAAITAELRKRADLDILAWPVFDDYPVDVMVTTRHGGASTDGHGDFATLNLSFAVGDDPAHVLANRRRVAGACHAGLSDFVFARQVHGRATAIVSRADRGRGAERPDGALPDADALVTCDPGTVLAILVADCVPIVLYDPAAHVVACVHAGWRGTVARVTQAALAAMSALGSRPGDVIAGIGPAIAPDRYRVGEQVASAARQAFGAGTPGVLQEDGPGSWLFDLWEANRLALSQAGVAPERIHVAGFPTGPDPGLFFSHRARQPSGRFALVARLQALDGDHGSGA